MGEDGVGYGVGKGKRPQAPAGSGPFVARPPRFAAIEFHSLHLKALSSSPHHSKRPPL